MTTQQSLEIDFSHLARFLDVAADYLADEKLLCVVEPPLPIGERITLTLRLPVFDERAFCLAKVSDIRPDGTLFQVLEWNAGHRGRVWRLVALGWAMLKAAGIKRYQRPPPPQASRHELTSFVFLEPRQLEATPTPTASKAPSPSPRTGDLSGESVQLPREGAGPRRPPPPSPSPSPARAADQAAATLEAARQRVSEALKTAPRPVAPVVRPTPGTTAVLQLKTRPLALLLRDTWLENRSGWLEVTATDLVRRIRFYEGNIIQVEQRPHAPVSLLQTAIRALGLPFHKIAEVAGLLAHADAPEEMLVSLGHFTSDQAERILSRRVSVQMARAIEEGWTGQATFLEETRTEPPSVLFPDPAVPLGRMIWDGLRAWVYRRSPQKAASLQEYVLTSSLEWRSSCRYPLSDVTMRAEEQDLILRCEEDLEAVLFYLEEEGRHDRMTLSVVWSLLQVGALRLIKPHARRAAQSWEFHLSRLALGNASGLEEGEDGDLFQTASLKLDEESTQRPFDTPAPSGPAPTDGFVSPPHEDPAPTAAPTPSYEESNLTEEERRQRKEEESILSVLRQKVSEMALQSHFDVLGLHWSVHPNDITFAFRELLSHYRHYTDGGNQQLVDASQEIIRRLVQAFELLNDADRRRQYRELLVGDDLDFGIKHALDQGGLHYLRGDNELALLHFERAADMAPTRPECIFELERQRKLMGLTP